MKLKSQRAMRLRKKKKKRETSVAATKHSMAYSHILNVDIMASESRKT